MQPNVKESLSEKSEKLVEANSFLRERYLYAMSSMCENKKCKIRMYDNTEVEGKIKAFDLDFQNIIVKELKTPSNQTIQSAILRTSDITTISYQ